MEDALVPIFLFVAIAAVLIVPVVMRAQTRRLMIERGLFGPDYAAVLGAEARMRTLAALKWGLVLGGVGLGLVLLPLFGLDDDKPSAAAFGLVVLGAAGGFLGYYLLSRKEAFDAADSSNGHAGAPAADRPLAAEVPVRD